MEVGCILSVIISPFLGYDPMVTDKAVFRPQHTLKERVWGHWYQFLVLQAQQSCDYLHSFVLELVSSPDPTLEEGKGLVTLGRSLGLASSGHAR